MATNRYTNLSYSSLNDLPLPTLPFEQLDQIMGQYQQGVDAFDALSQAKFNYIDQSESDRALAGEINKYQNSVADKLSEVAQTGDTGAYFNALKQGSLQLMRLRQPGGPIDALEQRYAANQKRKEAYNEFFKDQPWLAGALLQEAGYGDVGYSPGTGTYNPISTQVNAFKHYTGEERAKWFKDVLGTVKETLIDAGTDRKYFDGITRIDELWEVKGVTRDRVLGILESLYPQEFKQSIVQEHRALQTLDPSIRDLDTNMYIETPEGSKLNLRNPVAKEIFGFINAAAYTEYDSKFMKVKNEMALAKYKQDLKDQSGLKHASVRRGQLYTDPTKVEKSPIKVGNNGVVWSDPSISKDFDWEKDTRGMTTEQMIMAASAAKYAGKESLGFKQAYDKLMNPIEGEDQFKGYDFLMDKWKPNLISLGNAGKEKEALELWNQKFSEFQERNATHELLINTYNVKNKPEYDMWLREQKERVDYGGMWSHNSYSIIGKDGKTHTGLTKQAALDILGAEVTGDSSKKFTQKQLQEGAHYEGETSSLDRLAPSGSAYYIPDAEGNSVTLIGSESDVTENMFTNMLTTLTSPGRHLTGGTSNPVVIPDRDLQRKYPEGVYTKFAIETMSDQLSDRIRIHKKQQDAAIQAGDMETAKAIEEKIMNPLLDEYTKLIANPERDEVIRTGHEVYDQRFNPEYYPTRAEVKIGGIGTMDKLTELLEKMQ